MNSFPSPKFSNSWYNDGPPTSPSSYAASSSPAFPMTPLSLSSPPLHPTYFPSSPEIYPNDRAEHLWRRYQAKNAKNSPKNVRLPPLRTILPPLRLPSLHRSSSPSDDERPPHSDFDVDLPPSEFSEDADIDMSDASSERAEDSDDDGDNDDNVPKEEQGIRRATFFTVSAERGHWRAHPPPVLEHTTAEPEDLKVASALLELCHRPSRSSTSSASRPQPRLQKSSDLGADIDDRYPSSPLPPSSPALSPLSTPFSLPSERFDLDQTHVSTDTPNSTLISDNVEIKNEPSSGSSVEPQSSASPYPPSHYSASLSPPPSLPKHSSPLLPLSLEIDMTRIREGFPSKFVEEDSGNAEDALLQQSDEADRNVENTTRTKREQKDKKGKRRKAQDEPVPSEKPARKRARVSEPSPGSDSSTKTRAVVGRSKSRRSTLQVVPTASKIEKIARNAPCADTSKDTGKKGKRRDALCDRPSNSTSTRDPPKDVPASTKGPSANSDAPTAELMGLLIETLASTRASSLPASALYRELTRSRPTLLADRVRGAWVRDIEHALETGWRKSGIFGKVAPEGKDVDHGPEVQWFYDPDRDPDQERATLVRSMMPRPGKRSATKTAKRYYWRPLDKISRWDAEDDM